VMMTTTTSTLPSLSKTLKIPLLSLFSWQDPHLLLPKSDFHLILFQKYSPSL
jgi:hypothetical protein